jgi:hypothetical protein
MHMTRQRAKSSFTVEIKRANRRSPQIATAALFDKELLERVFGGLPGAQTGISGPAEKGNAKHTNVPDALTTNPRSLDRSAGVRPPERPARRILPDLLARDVDPVAQRMELDVAERAARRRAMRPSRRVSMAAASASEPQPDAPGALLPGEIAQQIIAPVWEEPVTAVEVAVIETAGAGAPAKRKRKARLDTIKARRTGSPPLFAAVERWKRRLPKACW